MPSRKFSRTEKILEAAAHLFAGQGYHATSTREIAQRAEVSENTLFRYFARKEELFWSALRSRTAMIAQSESLSGIRAGDPPEVALPKILEVLTETVCNRPEVLRLIAIAYVELQGKAEVHCRDLISPFLLEFSEYSEFHTDWSGQLGGPSIWADWGFNQLPGKLHGLGVEVNGRDLNFNRSGSDPRLRMDVAEGGPMYTWRRDRPFRPYVKFLVGLGSIDFTLPNYFHDTRTVYSTAGGIDYRFSSHLVVRVDYEYQFWTHFINDHTMNPEGLTIGINYDFNRPRRFE